MNSSSLSMSGAPNESVRRFASPLIFPYVTLQGPELPSGHFVLDVVLPKTVGS